ncbi:VOC family protein [Natrarchaeobius chitinivorans]|uniref:VOC family protein n=1 Tax=Natrarchaeobius chitinivorans TaxID=1679083 RepID=A0A3N6M3A0_NATCH|nr:VOC family protein [Natrarchaeobius chitinivorans]RQG94924.1 VOC family protein [Natrarchaeobius chitinivorans]
MSENEEQVSHLLLQASDLERTVEFYSEIVGFDVTERTDFGDGRPLVKLHVGMGLTELPDERADSGQAVEHIAFEISDIDGLVESLREHDVEIDDGPKETIYGTSVYFFDPDGNRIECHD